MDWRPTPFIFVLQVSAWDEHSEVCSGWSQVREDYLQTLCQVRGAFIPSNPKFKSTTCSVCNADTYLPNYCVWSLSVLSSLLSNISFKQKWTKILVYFYCQMLHFFYDWVSIKNFVTRMTMGISQCEDILRLLKLIRNCAVILMLLLTSVFATRGRCVR